MKESFSLQSNKTMPGFELGNFFHTNINFLSFS